MTTTPSPAPRFPNAPCHWWPNLTPEDATEAEINAIHKIAGDSSKLPGMTWQQYRENLKVCAADLRELTADVAKHAAAKMVAESGAVEALRSIHNAATDKAGDVMTDATWNPDYSFEFTLTVKQLREIDSVLRTLNSQ